MSNDGLPVEGEGSGARSGNARRRYLFTIDGENADTVLPLVCDIVADDGGELVIGNPVILPDQTPLSTPEPRMEADRTAAEFKLQAMELCQDTIGVEQVVKVGHSRESVVQHLIEENDISTLITEDHPRSGLRLPGNRVDDSSFEGYCDTIIVPRINEAADIDAVLVPVARGPHSGMAIDVGLALARQNDASVELLHVYQTGDDDQKSGGEDVLDHAADRIGSFGDAEFTIHDAQEVSKAIVEYTDPFDVTVLGAPREGIIRQFVFGTIPDTVSAEADGTVLIAHRANVSDSWLDRWLK